MWTTPLRSAVLNEFPHQNLYSTWILSPGSHSIVMLLISCILPAGPGAMSVEPGFGLKILPATPLGCERQTAGADMHVNLLGISEMVK